MKQRRRGEKMKKIETEEINLRMMETEDARNETVEFNVC